jgi:hypothetical protein
MAGETSRVEQALARYQEAERLSQAGFPERAVETLHAAAELAVEELAEREGLEWRMPDQSPHEARARAAVTLRSTGKIPAGYDKLLRRLNEDRKRTKYDGKPTRFDPMTLAQAQASVRLVLDGLGAAPGTPPAEAPPPAESPPPALEPRRVRRLIPAAAVAVALLAVAVVLLVSGRDDEPRRAAPSGRPVAAGATGSVGNLAYRATRVYTSSRLDIGDGLRSERGLFLVAYVRVDNRTDELSPLRYRAFRLRGRSGKVFPVLGRAERVALAVQPEKGANLQIPFDVPRDELRGARLLVDDIARSGRTRRPGIAMALPLESGIGDIKPGRWRGRTSQGERFTMRIDRGGVLRTVTLRVERENGRPCDLRFRGIYFIDERGRFGLSGGVATQGRFTSSTEARGEVRSTPAADCRFGVVTWTARTPLR